LIALDCDEDNRRGAITNVACSGDWKDQPHQASIGRTGLTKPIAADERASQSRYRVLVLGLLTGVYFLYLLDRNAILVTQELIKAEFHLDDTRMGLLIGAFYGISYGLAGLPIGWMIDRANRRNVLVVILSIWSGLTALCGVSTAYWHLVIVRMGVGASESGGSPASLSILSDIFPPERRATVTSTFFAGTSLGMVASYFIGGVVAREYGWRAVFLLYGLPGLLLALTIGMVVREPARHVRAANEIQGGVVKAALDVLRTPLAVPIYAGAVLFCTSISATGGWLMAFLMRVRGLDVATAGLVMAGAVGGIGVVGTITSGFLSDRARRNGPGGPLMVVGVSALINVAACIIAYNIADFRVVVAALCVFGLTFNTYPGPTTATLSLIVRPVNRGMAFALYALLANFIGGMGPLVVGMLSDHYFPGHLATAMEMVLVLGVFGGLTCLWAGRALNRLHGQRPDCGVPLTPDGQSSPAAS